MAGIKLKKIEGTFYAEKRNLLGYESDDPSQHSKKAHRETRGAVQELQVRGEA